METSNIKHPVDPQEMAWICETLAGRARSFDSIVLKYQDEVFNLIARTIGNRADAEDLAQNTFVNAFSNLKKYRKESSFKTWLYSIAINLMRNYWRSKKHKAVYAEADFQSMADAERIFSNAREDAHGEAAAEETRQVVDNLIALLPPAQKEIFVLHYIMGHSCEEISKILRMSVATIKIRLFRGRKYLFKKIKNVVIKL
jgi:RNA polymerase sigma-70 factor, ECF subfamily